MAADIAIIIADVQKKYKVYYDKGHDLKEKVLFRERNHYEDRWVLKSISFDVKKGEAIGIIGENGCGKSTLLKLMSKIQYPDKGTVNVKGRVSSLLELGAGFHPDMSGRENIYMNAAIFGLTKKEIDRHLQTIIDFSEMGEFIDNPVRTYSSGMYMRLAFAVAINVEADVLLIDEILAVGDISFQAKCFNKLQEIKTKGTTIVIVSHSLGDIERICDRSIWIRDGIIWREGRPYDVHPEYMAFMGEKYMSGQATLVPHHEPQLEVATVTNGEEDIPRTNAVESTVASVSQEQRWGSSAAKIKHVVLKDVDGNEKTAFCTGQYMAIEILYETYADLPNPSIGVGIFRNDATNCFGTNTFLDHYGKIPITKKGKILFIMKNVSLLPGEYILDVAIHSEEGFAYDYRRNILQFTMFSDIHDVGIARIDHEWVFANDEM